MNFDIDNFTLGQLKQIAALVNSQIAQPAPSSAALIRSQAAEIERLREVTVEKAGRVWATLSNRLRCDASGRVDDEHENTCGDCAHLCGEECGHHGREVFSNSAACDYFAEA